MISFKQYLTEKKDNHVVVTFGRLNPPHLGHLKVIEKVNSIKGEHRIFASQSHDPKKNPLEYKEKIEFIKEIFPKFAKQVVYDPKIKTIIQVLESLDKEGFSSLTLVVGSDRVKTMSALLQKYNGDIFNFANGVNVVSSGERDPDADSVSGMSASKMRKAVQDGDIELFKTGLPKKYKPEELFNTLRIRMKLDPIQTKTIREQYIDNEIFLIGESVMCEGKKYTISHRSSNFVGLKDSFNNSSKKFIKDISYE